MAKIYICNSKTHFKVENKKANCRDLIQFNYCFLLARKSPVSGNIHFGPKLVNGWNPFTIQATTRTLGVSLSSLGLSLPICTVGMGSPRKFAPSQLQCPPAWPAWTVLTPPLPPPSQALSQRVTPNLLPPQSLQLNSVPHSALFNAG